MSSAFALVSALLVARSAAASPEDLFGLGPRSAALGSTGVASAEGFEATWANPALLSSIRRNRLVVGFQGATYRLDAGGSRVSTRPSRGMIVGAELPMPFGGVLERRLALGFAFHTPTEILTRGRILYPDTAQFAWLPTRSESLTIRAGLGADVGHGFKFGVGFAALADLRGEAIIAASGANGKVASQVETQLVAKFAPTLGATYEWGARDTKTRVGVTYRGALGARFGVRVDATKLSTLALPPFEIDGLAQYDPASLSVELARETPRFAYALGASWKRWSEAPNPFSPTVRCPVDTPDCAALKPPAIALSDTVVVRLGVEARRSFRPDVRARIRVGTFLEPTPVPRDLPAGDVYDATSGTVVPVPTRTYDASRVAFTFGTGLDLRLKGVPFSVDAFGQVHTLVGRTQRTGTEVTPISGTVLATGMTVGVRL
ncbi:MAG: hypothetical protein U0169_12650 [Polyangiaceae bacterium]